MRGAVGLGGHHPRTALLRPSSFASNTLHWADAVKAGDPVPNLTGRGARTERRYLARRLAETTGQP